MSRHRGVRNRQFSYDDYDDEYYDEEDESYMDEEHQQYMRSSVGGNEGISLSSYFDVPPADQEQGQGQTPKQSNAGGGAPQAGGVMSTNQVNADDDLVAAIAAEIDRRCGQGHFPPSQVREAVVSSGYDVDTAQAILQSSEAPPANPPPPHLRRNAHQQVGRSAGVEPAQGAPEQPLSSLAFGLRFDGRGEVSIPAGALSAPHAQSKEAAAASANGVRCDMAPMSISSIRCTPNGAGPPSTVKTFQFDTPSPDDMALARQAQGGRGGRTRAGITKQSDGEVDKASSSASGSRVTPKKSPNEQGVDSWDALTPDGWDSSPALSREPPPAGARGLPRKGAGGGGGGGGNLGSLLDEGIEKLEETEESDVEGGEEGKKERLSMVVVGHVDAGKSTLMGQVLVKLGHVNQRTLHKQEKEAREAGKASFFLAWVMDEDQEERQHGVTIEVAQKHVETETKRITLLDAPGHRDFIPKMIGGAAAADVAILVVPATPGEFESGFEANGQTKEHATLVKALGVNQLLVVVNKLDAADPPWSRARFEEVKAKVEPFLGGVGFRPKRLRFLPASGLTGENVASRDPGGALAQWYDGPTLLEAMDAFVPGPRPTDKDLRMCVGDVPGGKGSVTVSGRVVQGRLRVGDKVCVMPLGDTATVTRLERNAALTRAVRAGDNADATLVGVDAVRLSVGNVLCRVGKGMVPVVRRFEAQIVTLGALQVPVIKGTEFQLHMHNVDAMVHCSKLLALTNSAGEVQRPRPRCIPADTNAQVRLSSPRPLCLEKYSDSRPLGRFVLRQKGVTVAVGLVLSTKPR